MAWVVRHPRWGTLGLPLLAGLYVRARDVPSLPRRAGWTFQTKLELAARRVTWLVGWGRLLGRTRWVVVEGGYPKAPFLQPALRADVVVVGRLRQDAALRDVLPPRRPGPRGRPRLSGSHVLSRAKRAGHPRAWQTVTAVLDGQRVTKTVKTFLATWRPVGGAVRVVLIRAAHRWLAFFWTAPTAPGEQLLQAVADRAALAQNFHDLKEVEGRGQQQVRHVWANGGAFHLNLGAHT